MDGFEDRYPTYVHRPETFLAMKRLLSAALCMVVATSAFGITPPKEAAKSGAPAARPPLVIEELAAPELRPAPAEKKAEAPKPLDAKTIEKMDIDPNLKRILLEAAGAQKAVTPEPPQPSDVDGAEPPTGPRVRSEPRVGVNTTIVGTGQATNDSNQDYEPAIIVNQFSGTNRATTVFMKYDTGTMNPKLHYRTTTDFVNFTGGQLPLPTNHTMAADPILAENYSTSGQFPKRTYCSGISLQVNGLGQYTNGALNVWHTDNPGTTAFSLTTVDTATSPAILDKPSIWVSWHSGTLGYTYMAAILASGGTNTIRVYRKTTTSTWSMVNNSISGAGVQSPIITVDVNNGDVYVAWINWSTSTINIARSTNQGSTFGTPVSFAAGTIVNGSGNICDSGGGNCLRGTSVIMARPNAADNSIGVVWHRRDSALSQNTDVYFNAFDISTQAWRTATLINDSSTGDQWNPALDPDSNGNYMITWYDRRLDPNDRKYITYGARVNASGAALDPSNIIVYSNIRASETNQFPADAGGRRYMGEYQDIWEWLGTWYSITMYAPDPSNGGSGQPDLFLTRIQP